MDRNIEREEKELEERAFRAFCKNRMITILNEKKEAEAQLEKINHRYITEYSEVNLRLQFERIDYSMNGSTQREYWMKMLKKEASEK